MKAHYIIQKKTTKGWATIAVKVFRIAAWWFERKYLRQNPGSALRRIKSIYK